MNLISTIRLRVASVLLLTLTLSLGPMARSIADKGLKRDALRGTKGQDQNDKEGEDGRPRRAPESSFVHQTPAYSVAGVLIARGNVTVNDNLAPTGTTVLNGSAIATGGDGIASIDLGPKGLIEMRTDTKILLNVLPEQIEVELHNCGTFTQ